MKNICLVVLLILTSSCVAQKMDKSANILADLTKDELWHLNSFETDSIPGIDLYRAQEFLNGKKSKVVTVAIIDSDVDLNHPWIRDMLWSNKNEMASNGKDDDSNGYIDDIHGWNFTKNTNGEKILYATSNYTNFIQYYNKKFKDKTLDQIGDKDTTLYKKYNIALQLNEEAYEKQLKKQVQNEMVLKLTKQADSIVKKALSKDDYTLDQVDSLYQVVKKGNDKILTRNVFITYNKLKHKISRDIADFERLKEPNLKSLDTSFNDRTLIGDDVHNIDDKNYGSPVLNNNLDLLTHGTTVSGMLSVFNFRNKPIIKLMNLSVSPKVGGVKDKDLALAIRYAVDNGAKVISFSITKSISIHNDWVSEAIKYALDNDVIFITIAGNSSRDIDKETFYPDGIINGNILDNFIRVGATTKSIDKDLMASFSGYGKNTVDIFAPGKDIYSSYALDTYRLESGTSIAAPLVAGVIALIKSYYPNLTPNQIKEILYKSVDKYDVKINLEDDKKVPFSDLSISGGIINAYKAVKMADKVANKRK